MALRKSPRPYFNCELTYKVKPADYHLTNRGDDHEVLIQVLARPGHQS